MNFRNFLVFSLYFGATETKISHNFEKCRPFFYKGIIPILKNPTQDMIHICQCYRNRYYYATLYDTKNRIPVYSASELLQKTIIGKRLNDKYFVEPKQPEPNDNQIGNMVQLKKKDMKKNFEKFKEQQALDTDYKCKDCKYTKGHLNPQSFNTQNKDSRYATNTYTNFAPQYGLFNSGTWSGMEKYVLNTFKEKCNIPGARSYFVVGVQPNRVNKKMNNRVNVPEFYWTAICCDTSSADNVNDRMEGWSFAYKADNEDTSSVFVYFYPVHKFLENHYAQIFATHVGNDPIHVQACQFNRNKAVNIITDSIRLKKFGAFPKFEPNPTHRFE